MGLIMLVACIAFEAIPLCPHIRLYLNTFAALLGNNIRSTTCDGVLSLILTKSTAKYRHAIPIPFCSTNLFQYQDMEEGSGDFKTTMHESVREFTRANEIAEHIIRVDFDT